MGRRATRNRTPRQDRLTAVAAAVAAATVIGVIVAVATLFYNQIDRLDRRIEALDSRVRAVEGNVRTDVVKPGLGEVVEELRPSIESQSGGPTMRELIIGNVDSIRVLLDPPPDRSP